MKSHFQFSNKERNGIFLLLLTIVVIQTVWWVSGREELEPEIESDDIELFRNEVDSLRTIQIKAKQPKLYPFNPNFISDYKGYTLGMSNEEIDRLHKFRAKDNWINSIQQFQDVTKVSDSLLNAISPFFKFPEWIKDSKNRNSSNKYVSNTNGIPKSFDEKRDLNEASAKELQAVYGIGEKLSKRILEYRNKFELGFNNDVELSEVYGLDDEVIARIKAEFTVKTPRPISKINLNEATRDQLVNIKYIDYEVANNIIEERTLREGFKSFEELTKVEQFPVKKLEIIKLYLHL